MRLTPRCMDMLKLLSAARWLRTRQLRRRFFAGCSVNAAQKRLRALAAGNFVRRLQPNRMEDALFTLGPEGKRVLERGGLSDLVLHRQVPKQLEHFSGVNDIRIAAELSFDLNYFFAYWELASIGWKQPIIPDAVFGVESKNIAVEFDRGNENVRFFAQKLKLYERGFHDFPLDRILVVTDRKARIEAFAKAVSSIGLKMLFTTIDVVQQQMLSEPICFENAHRPGVTLL